MSVIIHFFNGYDLSIENHYLQKGYRNDIILEINDLFYEVHFFTDDALKYEIREDGFFALPGIIILDEITNQKIIKAVSNLVNMKYFDSFYGNVKNPINSRFASIWYQNDMTFPNYDNLSTYVLGSGSD